MKKQPLSAELLRSFETLANKASVGVLAIADKNGLPIVFASKIDHLLGYGKDELLGKTFARILPLSVRDRHKALMEAFKAGESSSESRSMRGGLTVRALHSDGHEVEILVDISYHASLDAGTPGIYLAFIQDPANVHLAPTQISSLKVRFGDILEDPGAMVVAARKAIAKKVAASGGIIGFTVWGLTQITPLGTAIKGAIAAWHWESATKAPPSVQIGVYKAIDPETRLNNIKMLLAEVQKGQPEVIAIAYYKIEQLDPFLGRGYLSYRADSENSNGEQVYFENQVLTGEEVRKLTQLDCFIKKDVARLVDRKSQPKVEAIVCPTYQVAEINGLPRQVLGNASAIAFAPGTKIELEPTATILFQASPSLESLTKD